MSLDNFLQSLIREQGRDFLRQRGPVIGLMADRYPNDQRGRHLLRVAYENGIVDALLHDTAEHVQRQSAQKLVAVAIDAAAANEVVTALARALGHSAFEPKTEVAGKSSANAEQASKCKAKPSENVLDKPNSTPSSGKAAPAQTSNFSDIDLEKLFYIHYIPKLTLPSPRIGERWHKVSEFQAGLVNAGLFASKDFGYLRTLTWLPNNCGFATLTTLGGVLSIWNIAGKKKAQLAGGLLSGLNGGFNGCGGLAFQRNTSNPLLGAVTFDGRLLLWNEQLYLSGGKTKPCQEFSIFNKDDKHITPRFMAWHPTDPNLLALSLDLSDNQNTSLSALVFDVGKGRVVLEKRIKEYDLEWANNGQFLVGRRSYRQHASNIELWDLQGNTIDKPWATNPPDHFSWHPAGKFFCYVVQDHKEGNIIEIIDTESFARIYRYSLKPFECLGDLRWSPDGRYLAVRAKDGDYYDRMILIFDVIKREIIQQFPCSGSKAGQWSPNGSRLLIHTEEGLILVDPKQGQQLAAFATNQLGIEEGPSYLWSPLGDKFAFASNKGVVSVISFH